MTTTEFAPAVSVDEALRVFHQTLRALEFGPQCPCTLALNIAMSERELYPFLAELLARDWVYLVSDLAFGGTESSHAASDPHDLDRLIQEIRERNAALAGGDVDQNVAQASENWFWLFRELSRRFGDDTPPFYVALSRQGVQALQSMRSRRLA